MLKYISNNTFLLLIVFLMQFNFAMATGNEEDGKKLIKKGEYELALPIFEELHILYPSDPMFTYYYGVCLTETGNYTLKTRKLLLRSSLREVPADVYYYIGINYHAQNDYETAIAYYSRFAEMIKKKELKKYDVGSLKVDCEQKKNPFLQEDSLRPMNEVVDEEIVPGSVGLWFKKMAWNKNNKKQMEIPKAESDKLPKVFISKELRETLSSPTYNDSIKNVIDSSLDNENTQEPPEDLSFMSGLESIIQTEIPVDFEIPEELLDANIDFNLTSDIFYSLITQFKDLKARYYFVEGWTAENELNSILEKTDQLRSEYVDALTEEEQQSIAQQVVSLEEKSHELKDYSDFAYTKARELELLVRKESSDLEIEELNTQNQDISDDTFSSEEIYRTSDSLIEPQPELILEAVDTLELSQEVMPMLIDSSATIAQDSTTILESEPLVEEENVKVNDEIASEEISQKKKLEFKVQIGEFSDEYPAHRKKVFDDLAGLGEIDAYIHPNGLKLYTIGSFDLQKDAAELQKKVRERGVKDAFVVVFYNGKRITLKEASNISAQ